MNVHRCGTRLPALVLSLALSVPSFAGTTTVFDFLRTDVGARAAAMAGSFVTMMDDPNTIFYNTAALGTLQTAKGSAGFFKHLLDINSGSLSYGQAVQDIGTFGVGVIYTNYGSFTQTDEVGNITGSFNASDLAFDVGYSNTLEENLYYGVGAKFIYSSIAGYSSSALAGDFGLLYTIPDSKVTIGASIRNAGGQLSTYLGTREDLPLDLTVGASVVPKGLPLLLNVSFHKLNENTDRFWDRLLPFTVGGEFTASKSVFLRFGFNNEQRKDLKIGTTTGLEGFSAGIGIIISDYRFDYALSSLGSIGSLHRISIGTNF